jgi:polysaccharide export outer membrane protein
MKTSVAISFSALIVCGTAAVATAQGSRPPSAPPPAPPPTSSASTTAKPVPPTTAPAPASATAATDYRLVTGDKLRIEVYKDPQLSQSLQIRPDGKITLPLVGDVPASGKTSAELRDTLTTSLKEYMNNPVVTVIVVETMPQFIHVMGEVNTPGPQPVSGELDILKALSAAGGFTAFGNKKSILIMRKGPKGEERLTFNYNDALKGKAKVLALRPGDVVIVK